LHGYGRGDGGVGSVMTRETRTKGRDVRMDTTRHIQGGIQVDMIF
jgi:hypothetical protein